MVSLPKRKYTAEFRAEAVKLVREGMAQAEAARRLGITQTTLSTWCTGRRKLNAHALAAKPVSDKDVEIARLRRENAELRMERDILRKATAYFAKESR